jgi:two-component system chemotaxis sensor kinase CheA
MGSRREHEFQKKLLATYKVEAEEHLGAISDGLLKLEKVNSPADRDALVELICREAHSLKGASRAVNMDQVELGCKTIEDVFTLVKKGGLDLCESVFDAMHQSLDIMKSLLNIDPGEDLMKRQVNEDLLNRIANIESILENGHQDETGKETFDTSGDKIDPLTEADTDPGTPDPYLKDTVRVPVSRLDSILSKAEELISVKLAMSRQLSEYRDLDSKFDEIRSYLKRQKQLSGQISDNVSQDNAIIKSAKKHGKQESLFDCFEGINSAGSHLQDQIAQFEQEQKAAGTKFQNLLEDVRGLLLLPFSTITDLFPRLVRDILRDQGKKADLNISGADLEIDRRILEVMKDPLIHIIRNCVDHGLEKPDERKALGKDETGKIDFSISLVSGGMVEVAVLDDGRGIDLDSVCNKAVEMNLVGAGDLEGMHENEKYDFIFHSGLSTSRIITDISGRGLGMTIVQEKVEQFGGHIAIESGKNTGTCIRIILPLSFGSFRGVNVFADNQEYVIPARYIENVLRIHPDQVKTLENKEVVAINGESLSYLSLDELLGLGKEQFTRAEEKQNALLIRTGNRKLAARVSKIVKEQEILIKPLPEPLHRVRYIEGVALLGSGDIVPVLNVQDIFKSVDRGFTTSIRKPEPGKVSKPLPAILVVEDSMTSRMILTDILESAGYSVKTAVDGQEALEILQQDEFQLVLSDIEMPRIDGFELTSRVRKDKNISELPVILVTTLSSPEHREKGMEAGANAYIEKGNFEPKALLNIVEKLI